MDDDLELNFAVPTTGDRGVIVKRQTVQKGGRWTDRAKSRKDARKVVKRLDRVGQTQATAPPPPIPVAAPVSTPAPVPTSKAPQTARPATGPTTIKEQSITTAATSRVPRSSSQASPAQTSRPAQNNHHSRPSTSRVEKAVAARVPRVAQIDLEDYDVVDTSSLAGPSRQQAVAAPIAGSSSAKSKAPQFISSLFSAQGLPSVPSSSSTPVLGAPSNAPLTGDTNTFPGIGLDPLLVHHLTSKMSLKAPTAIQRSALPFMLSEPLDTTFRDESERFNEAKLRDVFIQSQTGSGKTLTYLLPIVQTLLPLSKLSYIDRSIGTLAIILAPTRELAQQIEKVLDQILSMALSLPHSDDDEIYTRWLVSGLLTGGATRTHEKARLRKGVPILVSTPGRLLDHLQNTSSFQCAKTLFLVLDEADRLMDLGFEETIQGIIKALDGRRRLEIAAEKEMDAVGGGTMRWPFWGRGRRTVLCSATVDAKVERLAGAALHEPIVFRGAREFGDSSKEGKEEQAKASLDPNAIEIPSTGLDKFTPPSQLSQKYVVVPTKLRLVALIALLRSIIAGANDSGNKVIVFLSSTDAVDYHWKLLGSARMDGTSEAIAPETVSLKSPLFKSATIQRLHGSLPLATRRASLAAFAEPSPSPAILLATSVASRGLDLPLVRSVIQYDLPTEGGANEYVHRVGRTARAGKGGEAWALVGPAETGWVEWVENKMGSAEGDKGKGVKLGQVGVEDVLKKGFGGKGYEYETRATEVQLTFERWVIADDQNAAQARKAFASYVRAYSTHPFEEKSFFHTKSLHLGHLAKAFALREAPSALTPSIPKAKTRGIKTKNADGTFIGAKRKRDEDEGEGEEEKTGGKERLARNETERRMYEAVRKAGRAVKSGGALGEVGKVSGKGGNVGRMGAGGAGDEFQVMGAHELERMVKKR